MNIFTLNLVPINPPADDAVKNMLVGIAKRKKENTYYFVSSFWDRPFEKTGNVIFFRSPFQRTGRHSMSFMQKIYIFTMMLLSAKKIDLFQFIITPQPFLSLVLKKLLSYAGKPSVQVVPSVHTLYQKNKEPRASELFFADRVVVHSDHTASVLRAIGVKGVVRVYPGVDIGALESIAAGEKENRYKIRERMILYAGSYKILERSFGLDEFLEMSALITKKNGDVKIVMACRLRTDDDRRLMNIFISSAEKMGIRGMFSFEGTVEDMPRMINAADICIMPCKNGMPGVLELPMVLLEAAALGKVIVYGNVPPLGEMTALNIGVAVDGGDAKKYAIEIGALLSDGEKRRRIGEVSRASVARNFSIDRVAEDYENIYTAIRGRG